MFAAINTFITLPSSFKGFIVYPVTDKQVGTWTVPAGVTSLTVEAVGIGGKIAVGSNAANTGGGGGAYAKSIISVTSNQTIYYGGNASTSMTGSSNTQTVWVNKSSNSIPMLSSDGVSASSGNPGHGKTGAGGGDPAVSIGTVIYGGGSGRTVGGTDVGGGGAAGPNGAGGNGSTTAGGSTNGGILAGPTSQVTTGYTYIVPAWGGTYGVGTGGFGVTSPSTGGAAGGGASYSSTSITTEVLGGPGIIVITY